ncbi:unnamed protein product, partial [Rotaria sordida]
MSKAENRDFEKYYGITGLKNHFTIPTGDECSSSIIFRPPLAQTILKADYSASSFMTLGKYGTGKTNEVNKAALELFCRSSVSHAILPMVMANNFYLSIFYPKIDGINIEDAIIRKDKFPTHTITWNTTSLLNYADYVLQEMNKNTAKTRCEAFTDFKTLVNYSNKQIANIIAKIPTPRALHCFIVALIREMNIDASS